MLSKELGSWLSGPVVETSKLVRILGSVACVASQNICRGSVFVDDIIKTDLT